MKKTIAILAIALAMSMTASAELQNVTVSGEITIAGYYYSSEVNGDSPRAGNDIWDPAWSRNAGNNGLRWPGGSIWGRSVLGANILSPFSWETDGHAVKYVEQRTLLGVEAEFTQNVKAFIQLDSYDVWGEDFRSNYITGGDRRGSTIGADGDVEIYQAYIQADEMWGMPIGMRVGRQELSLGSEWLVGNSNNIVTTGLSFDAVRVWYAADAFRVDAFWAKLQENSPMEEDGDVDLYGIYGTYTGLEDITIDAYWLFLRDAIAQEHTVDNQWGLLSFDQAIEDWFGVDGYEPTELHTIGLRGTGTIMGAIDFEAEIAYQFGEVDSAGVGFVPVGLTYGDDDADIQEWAMNLEVGYTFDFNMQPRVFLGFAYFGGEDERDTNFGEWLNNVINPWAEGEASLSFNRLFSDKRYSEFLDLDSNMSNVMIFRSGVQLMPTENVEVEFVVSYFETLEEFDAPCAWLLKNCPVNTPFFTPFPFLTDSNDDDLGWEIGLYATYNYSEDLSFSAGWAHLFVGDGLAEGNYTSANGLVFNGGTNDDDADYLTVSTSLSF